jgi:hypothetical protein
MLHEIVGLADEPPAKRRWFHDDYFDLFVWQTAGGELLRFQLCYGIHSSERALTWDRQSGFFHDGLLRSSEPIAKVIAHFDRVCPTLPKMIRKTVGARLDEFGQIVPTVPSRRKAFRRATWQKRLPAASTEPSA